MNQKHVLRSMKPVPSLLPNVGLRAKKIKVFISNTRSFQCDINTDEMILQEILSLVSGFKYVRTMS